MILTDSLDIISLLPYRTTTVCGLLGAHLIAVFDGLLEPFLINAFDGLFGSHLIIAFD